MPEYRNTQINKVDVDSSNVRLSPEEIEFKRDQSKEKLNKCEQKVYQRAQNYREKYGEDDYRTEIMVNFLLIAEMLENIIEEQEAFQDVEFLFNDSIQIIDENLEISQRLTQSQNEKNYGFFARLKQKREIKKAQRNNANRIKMLVYRINSVMESATIMTTEMRKSMIGMKEAFDKAKKANAKLDNKGKGLGKSESNGAVLAKFAQRFNDTENINKEVETKKDDANNGSNGSSDISDIL